jgi:hypothetical protein
VWLAGAHVAARDAYAGVIGVQVSVDAIRLPAPHEISELDQHVLSNHSLGAHNVNATYISQHIGHLAKCADKIDAGIKARTQPRKRKQRHLRAV